MNCRRARKLIYDFIDGMIADQDRLTLEQHIGACSSCEQMASGLSRSLDLLHRVAPEELDENFTWKVRLRLARERNTLARESVSHTSWVRSWNTRFAFSALSTLVVVIAVGYFSFGPAGVSVGNLPASGAPAEIAAEELTGFLESPLLKQSAFRQVAKPGQSNVARLNRTHNFGPYGTFTPRSVSTGAGASLVKSDGVLKEDTSPEFLTAKELKMSDEKRAEQFARMASDEKQAEQLERMVSDEKRAEQLEQMIVDLRTRLEACGCEDH